jgi:exonuclease III
MNAKLNLLIWNVYGIYDTNKCSLVKDCVKKSNCDIFCLQETKWSEHLIFRVRSITPFRFVD